MKRDLDLVRQLLLDIENRGADCSVSVLRGSSDGHHEERIRYHLRLLLDAQLLKEIDRTTAGTPCVRLTHQGHELLELVRDESVWREALQVCYDRTGSLSLTVIQGLLGSWAHRRARQPLFRRHRPYPVSGDRLEPASLRYREELAYPVESGYPFTPAYPVESCRPSTYRNHAEWDYPEVRYVPVRETQGEPWRAASRTRVNRFDLDGAACYHTAEKGLAESPDDSTLTDHIL
jgi:hypothetical protein